MATVMSAVDPTAGEQPHTFPDGSAKNQLPRRRREDLEALAADFVNSKIHVGPPAAKKLPMPALAALAAVVVVVLAWLLWPQAQEVRPDAHAAAPAVNEADLWARRMEAERERKRKQLGSSDYMAKMAAADSALMKEMASRGTALAAVPESPAEPAAKVAKPQDEPAPKATESAPTQVAAAGPAQSAPVPAPAESRAEAKAAEPAPAQAASEPQPAAREPTNVAAVDPSECRLHVSTLSLSGKLTYADVAKMKGSRIDARGHVYTPPVRLDDGRRVIFEVLPTGCVNWRRT